MANLGPCEFNIVVTPTITFKHFEIELALLNLLADSLVQVIKICNSMQY